MHVSTGEVYQHLLYEWYWQNLIENYSISQRCKPDKMDRMKYLPS